MERKRLGATQIRSVGYDQTTQTLEVELPGGAILQYARVSPEVYRRLMAAPSPGSYYRDNIEESYSARRLR